MDAQTTIRVEIEGVGTRTLDRPTTILDLKSSVGPPEDPLVPVVGALFDNRIMGLEYLIHRSCRIRFLTTGDEEGAEIYRRSLSELLHAAFIDLAGKGDTLKVEHSLNKGYFFSYVDRGPLPRNKVRDIERRMREIVARDVPFEKCEFEREDALGFFRRIGAWDRYYLLKYSDRAKVILYRLGECINLAQGPLVPSTGYLKLFSLAHYPPGLVLNFPEPERPGVLPAPIEQSKLFRIYSEHRDWSKILDVSSAGKLNRLIVKGKIDDLVWVSEGLHEKKIAGIADTITRHAAKKRIVLLAGPSSSGKTTFAKRLTIQLLANGIGPAVISLDNYYLPRSRMPKNGKGEHDLESLYALDVELINRHLLMLLKGERVSIPRYDFKTGHSEKDAGEIVLGKNQILIVEGIHGLNEELTKAIPKDEKLKIYISALTQLNLDYINRIPTSMVRLLRRVVRDHQFRSYTARETLAQWPLVRTGEGKHTFPFQEDADIMFNSSLVYEMSVLKLYAEPLLKDIEEDTEMYTQAKRLLHFTSNFLGITSDHVPLTSILREFIGGSGFEY